MQKTLQLISVFSISLFMYGCSFLPKNETRQVELIEPIIKQQTIEKRTIIVAPKSCGIISTPSASLLFNLTWVKIETTNPKVSNAAYNIYNKLQKEKNDFDCLTASWDNLSKTAKVFILENIYNGKIIPVSLNSTTVISDFVLSEKELKADPNIGELSLIYNDKSLSSLARCYDAGCVPPNTAPALYQEQTYKAKELNLKLD